MRIQVKEFVSHLHWNNKQMFQYLIHPRHQILLLSKAQRRMNRLNFHGDTEKPVTVDAIDDQDAIDVNLRNKILVQVGYGIFANRPLECV